MTRRFVLPASSHDKTNLLLVATGSVAAIKIPLLLSHLDSTRFSIILLPSHSALPFLPPLESLPCLVYCDNDEWSGWTRGDEILHIELRKWADLVLVAPLSAHSMAKLSVGHCDALWLEVLRAWDYALHATPLDSSNDLINGKRNEAGWKEVVCAPAMNTCMYTHPFTAKQLTILQDELQYQILGPVEKTLACGDVGTGGMVEVNELVNFCEAAHKRMRIKKSLHGSSITQADT